MFSMLKVRLSLAIAALMLVGSVSAAHFAAGQTVPPTSVPAECSIQDSSSVPEASTATPEADKVDQQCGDQTVADTQVESTTAETVTSAETDMEQVQDGPQNQNDSTAGSSDFSAQ